MQFQRASRKSYFFVLAILAALCAPGNSTAPALAAGAVEQASSNVTVGSGLPVNVGEFTLPLPGSCHDKGVTIKITKPPAHGKVYVRTGEWIYKGSAVAECDGRTVSGRQVFYQSDKGYTGSDQFEFSALYVQTTLEKTIHVTVT